MCECVGGRVTTAAPQHLPCPETTFENAPTQELLRWIQWLCVGDAGEFLGIVRLTDCTGPSWSIASPISRAWIKMPWDVA